MYSREVALPSSSVGPGKSIVITTSFPFRSMPSELPLWMLKSMGAAQYPLSIIINSFTPNQQGHNMLQLQLSTIFPLKFHVMAMYKPMAQSYLFLMVEVSINDIVFENKSVAVYT
jgi:hypothetical protein